MKKNSTNKNTSQENSPVDPKTDKILGHILQNHDEHANKSHKIAENHMMATAHGNKMIENGIEASGQILDENKKTNETLKEISDKVSPKDIQKIQIVPADDEGSEDDQSGSDLASQIFALLKGKKGPKGDSPSDEQLTKLIEPLIPPAIPGESGKTPTKEELMAMITPLVVELEKRISPTDKKLLALIKPLVAAIEVEPGERGSPGKAPTKKEMIALIKEVFPTKKKITSEAMVKLIKKKFSYYDLLDTPNLENAIAAASRASKTVSLAELDDVDLSGLTQTGGKYNLGSGTGSGGASFETPSGTINGSNAAFSVIHTPKAVILNGATYFQNDGYTLSGLNITMLIVPATGSTLRSMY